MKPKRNKILYFFLTTVLTTILDLNLSDFIISNLESINSPELAKVMNIAYFQNTGAAFSILENNTMFLALVAISAIILLVTLLIRHINEAKLIDCFLIATLTSGIICNTYERLTFGFVRDFFQLNFISFPIFNISDILINISVLAIMIRVIQYNKKKSENE